MFHQHTLVLSVYILRTEYVSSLDILVSVRIASYIVYGQRHINITGNAIGPKSGQKDGRKF